MSTSAPIRKVYDIPIIKPVEEPQRLNPGIPVPAIIVPVKVPVKVSR